MINTKGTAILITLTAFTITGCSKKENINAAEERQPPAPTATQEAHEADSKTVAFKKADAKAKEYLLKLYPKLDTRIAKDPSTIVTVDKNLDDETDGIARYNGIPVTGFILETNWSGNTIIYQNEQTYNDLSASISSIKSITEYKEGRPNGWKLTPEREYLEIKSTYPKSDGVPIQYEEFSFLAEFVFEKGSTPDWKQGNSTRKLLKVGFFAQNYNVLDSTLDKSINTIIEQGLRPADRSATESISYAEYRERDTTGKERSKVEVYQGQSYLEEGHSPEGKFTILSATQGHRVILDIYEQAKNTSIRPYAENYNEIQIYNTSPGEWSINYTIGDGGALGTAVSAEYSEAQNKIKDLKVSDSLEENDPRHQKLLAANEEFCLKTIEVAKKLLVSRKEKIDDVFLRNAIPKAFTLPITDTVNFIR